MENKPLNLGKFQLKLLETVEQHSLEIYVFFGVLLLISLIIAIAVFVYFNFGCRRCDFRSCSLFPAKFKKSDY